jgi:hypothetical protein
VTGQSALWKMYQVARSWAADAEVLKYNSIRLTEVPDTPGKSGAWEVVFTSRSKGRAKSYTYSVVESEGTLHEGVFGGQEQPWTSGAGNAPFLIGDAKADTDAALKTALANGGTEVQRGQPKQPLRYVLEKLSKYENPAWRVIWGESVGTSAFSVYVDAKENKFLGRLH